MLSFRFQKSENAIYISHIDVLRMINRTLRRADITINFSQGFNPHRLINLSQPLPLGLKSNAEWATLQTDLNDTESFLNLYNKVCPSGFKAVECFVTDKKPNIAGKVCASDYFIYNTKASQFKDKIQNINKNPLIIKAKNKIGEYEKDVCSLIYDIEVKDKGIWLRLAFGNTNLRIDKLAEKMNNDFGLGIVNTDITRLEQLINNNGKFLSVTDYIKGLR